MEPPKPDSSPKYLWNPLSEDYHTAYDSKPYTVRSLEISEFPAYIANKIAKNLAQYIVLKRGVKTNYEDEYNAALEEITVKL